MKSHRIAVLMLCLLLLSGCTDPGRVQSIFQGKEESAPEAEESRQEESTVQAESQPEESSSEDSQEETKTEGSWYISSVKYYNEDGSMDQWEEYTYDENGNLIQTTDYTEDGIIEKVVKKQYNADGTLQTSEYDAEGRLVTYSVDSYDEQGQQILREVYDGQDQLLESIEMQYDAQGNQIYFAHFDGDGNCLSLKESTYDEYGNRTYYRVVSQSGSEQIFTNEYVYDEEGRMLERAYYYDGTLNGTEVYEYDEEGRLISMQDGNTETRYWYENGLMVKKYEKTNFAFYTEYTYDEKENLVFERCYSASDLSPSYSIQYQYDDQGNCLSQTYTDGFGDSYVMVESIYDEFGNERSFIQYNAEGEVISVRETEYIFIEA